MNRWSIYRISLINDGWTTFREAPGGGIDRRQWLHQTSFWSSIHIRKNIHHAFISWCFQCLAILAIHIMNHGLKYIKIHIFHIWTSGRIAPFLGWKSSPSAVVVMELSPPSYLNISSAGEQLEDSPMDRVWLGFSRRTGGWCEFIINILDDDLNGHSHI